MTGWTWKDDATGWCDHAGTPLVPDRAARYWRAKLEAANRHANNVGGPACLGYRYR